MKPYILGANSSGSMGEVKNQIREGLKNADFTIVGEYMPMDSAGRWVIVVNHPALNRSVKAIGGLTGFASTLRLAVTQEGKDINISYANPTYWGNAYFRDDFDKVSDNYKELTKSFIKAVSSIDQTKDVPFGSKEGLDSKELRNYHYMFGMPYFDDTKKMKSFSSYEAAVSKIEQSLASGKNGVEKIYRHDVPGTKLTLYGFALTGDEGETNFMPKIDISSPKHTAFLPYELLVNDSEVHMLHGRFRIALSFPDLTMGTFTKIMSTPGNIQDLLMQLVED
jgi:hypothetical protein